jgi:hypothetical protein|tara:strand:- start:2482 stop:2955 length:474 start_codon:yes stop_codon:yes gene_type:complete
MNVVVNIKGGSKTQKKHTQTMVEFCVKLLMPRMKTLEINVHIKDFKEDDSYGYAIATNEACDVRPREFDVDINKHTRLRRLLETVAHEMVHVKQFARGELYQSSVTAKHRWQGNWQRGEKHYYDLPWEIEAHGREIGLFVRWAETNGHASKAWTQED